MWFAYGQKVSKSNWQKFDLIMVLNAVWDADAPRSKVGIWKSHLYMHYSLTFSTEVIRFVPRGL